MAERFYETLQATCQREQTPMPDALLEYDPEDRLLLIEGWLTARQLHAILTTLQTFSWRETPVRPGAHRGTHERPPIPTPKEAVLAAMHAYREAHAIPDDALVQLAVPGEHAWEEWRTGPDMIGNPATSVIALQFEGFGAFYGSAEQAIADLESYYEGYE